MEQLHPVRVSPFLLLRQLMQSLEKLLAIQRIVAKSGQIYPFCMSAISLRSIKQLLFPNSSKVLNSNYYRVLKILRKLVQCLLNGRKCCWHQDLIVDRCYNLSVSLCRSLFFQPFRVRSKCVPFLFSICKRVPSK